MQAVLLARVSTKEQEEGHSLIAQLNRLHEYCNQRNLEIIQEFTIVESSTRGERPEFQKMIQYIKHRKQKVALVCDKVDRLQRSFREVPILENLRKSNKLVLHFVSDNQILDSNANNSQIMAYQMFVIMAENYTNCISDNVKRSFEKKLQEGTILAAAPVGYLNVSIDGKKNVVIDPIRGEKVRKMFEYYSSGMTSIRDLVMYAKQIGLTHRNGKYLSRSQILYMLHNPFYYGKMKIKGKLYNHIYEPIISKSLFDSCSNIAHKRHNQAPTKAKKEFLLSGMIRCSHCGNLFSPYLAKGKYPFLQPPVNRPCVHYNVSESVIMAELEQIFKQLHFDSADKQALLDILEQKKAAEIINRDQNLSMLHNQAQSVSLKKSRLMDLFLEQGITREEFDIKNKELDSELSDIRHKISEFDNRIDRYYHNLPKMIEMADSCCFLLKSSRISEKRQIIKLITSNLFLDGKNPVITIRNPFKILSRKGQSLTWLGSACNYRAECQDEFARLTTQIMLYCLDVIISRNL